MAARIRRGTLDVNGAVANVANFEWTDAWEFDRSRADDEFSGTPVLMSKGGSGSLTLLAGSIATGYQTSDWVFTYNEVAVAAGVETVTQYTATFTQVTTNTGGTVPAEGKGEIRVSFEYAECTVAVVEEED